ncbi:MAG: OmpA family protein [Gammaproteobacteria bacterium]|nr:OmpA family protein [Gammaproteobacteria bacterium]
MIKFSRKLAAVLPEIVLLSCVISAPAVADNYMEFFESPEGKVEQPPVQLSSYPVGHNTEQHLPPDEIFTLWIQDETFFKPHEEDTVKIEKVLEKEARTFKLENVVKPIRFKSGEAEIPEEFVTKLRQILESMKHRANVRLHFIGHSDSDRLGAASKAKYGDNIGLSRARAEIAAEYFQRELDLGPDAVSYDGAGATKPIASNDTPQGKAQNRRVEVQVWYDEITEKAVEKEIVVPAQKLNRIKVCRKETVCKLRYKEGNAKRARLRNLVSPLRMKQGQTEIPAEFIRQIKEVLKNLRDQRNVVVRFVGHTDNLPLEDRQQRIYGDHVALSKARARRVALSIQDALRLHDAAVGSDGKGASYPVASNDTIQGRELNHRVEVEFWHDDPFEEFTADAQACPEAAAAETITLSYDPPTGPIRAIRFNNGQPVIPPGYADRLQRVMDELEDKSNVRLGFTGYTNNERMDRRTAMVYGDDIGLSTSRAQRAMKLIKDELGLTDKQVEFEGRGFVHSKDVVSTGFVQFDGSRVEVEVLYDELAVLEEDEGLDITRIDQEARARTPYALNMMRISVDGKPLHDPYKNIADLQRCTDVALEQAEIKFKFSALNLKPRLNITAWPNTIRYQNDVETEAMENRVQFRAYSNYPDFIERAEVRIFEEENSTRDAPLAIVAVDKSWHAEWLAEFEKVEQPVRKLKYLVRVYDDVGNYDETSALPLWVVDKLDEKNSSDEPIDINKELLVGYGENHLTTQRIPLSGGTVGVHGKKIPANHSVWIAGRPVPVNDQGEFVGEEIFRPGTHTVEVAVLDEGGNGELFLREMELKKDEWFYVGIADVTFVKDNTTGPANIVTGDDTSYENDLNTFGRLAFFVDGKFGDNWQLIASADTREGPIDEIFSNFMDKTPDALFRRLDPDYHYPSFGDDSTLVENAPTLGKFFVKLRRHNNYGMWGNFDIAYTDTDLAHIDRGLYGANGHYESMAVTAFGEQRLVVDGFAAEPGTISGRDEFRGTGGSLYFMRHQDILTGSERVRVEIRDKDSGIVIGVKNLVPVLDYDVDYIQGRLLLNEPLPSTSNDNLIVDSGSMSGHPVYLVARYEYTPGFDDLDDVAVGGRAHYWFNDNIKVGITSSKQEELNNESTLSAMDLTLRQNAGTWLKVEVASTEGQGAGVLNSNDGGFSFDEFDTGLGPDVSAGAYRLDGRLRLQDAFEGSRGAATFYVQNREAGFSAPGQLTSNDVQQFGGTLNMAITPVIDLNVKADQKDQDQSLETSAVDVDASYKLDEHWKLSAGARLDSREDHASSIASTQTQGNRADVAFNAAYNSQENWTSYGFAQLTANTTGNREENDRVGAGGTYRFTERLNMEGELSAGDTGTGAKLGTDYLMSDRTNIYATYALDNERSDNGLRSRKGNMNTGFRTRYSDTTSVYAEERYTHGDVPTGLTHATGVDIAPNDKWNYGVTLEMGTLEDEDSGAETSRLAMGLNMGYKFNAVKYAGALEYRADDTENLDLTENERKTWLIKNTFKYQINPDWRFVGKLNHSDSESSQGEFFDGNFTEAVLGYSYRPVKNDRLNSLFKYTYFFNMPTADQVTVNETAAEFIQKSHVFSIDSMYDLTRRWSIGGKYAYRLGEVSQERVDPEFFDSRASLYVLRADWHFTHRWDALIEARLLDLPDAQDSKSGTLLGLYRHVGKNIKFGIGYNFTDFSDDLTDLDYDSKGLFINLIAKI